MDGYLSEIKSPLLFFGAAAAVVGYILYTMIRRRRGERPGDVDREPLL